MEVADMELAFLVIGFFLAAMIRLTAPALTREEQIRQLEEWDRHVGLGG